MRDLTKEKDTCPKCGGDPHSVLETLLASALLATQEDGVYVYYGESKVHWDTQEPVVVDGNITLECGKCGHSYLVPQ